MKVSGRNFVDIDEFIVKFICEDKGSKTAKTSFEKGELIGMDQFNLFQNI